MVNVLETSAVPSGSSLGNPSETSTGPEIVQVSPTDTASGTAGRHRPSIGCLAAAGECLAVVGVTRALIVVASTVAVGVAGAGVGTA